MKTVIVFFEFLGNNIFELLTPNSDVGYFVI